MEDHWRATHLVPDGGLPTWSEPDASRPSDNSLAPGLEVRMLSARGEWVNVQCANEWTTWVQSKTLLALPPVVPANGQQDGGPPAAGPATGLRGFLDQLAKPGNGLWAGAAALGVGALTSYLLWPILAIPGKALKDAIPRGNCTTETPGSQSMYLCSVKAGTLTALGPFITIVVAVVFRQPIATQLRKLTKSLPTNSGVLLTPVFATAMFTMVHAAVHDNTADQSGIVPQRMFPALVGLFTFGAGRLAPAVARRYGDAIDARNRVPAVLRIVVALAIPLVSSYLLTNQQRVSDTAFKEQFIALLTLFTSYAAFVPRDGDFLGAGQRLLATKAQRRLARTEKPR